MPTTLTSWTTTERCRMASRPKLLEPIPPGDILMEEFMRLGKCFGTSPEIWLDLQSDYELQIARQTTWFRVEPTVQTRVA